MTATRLTPAQRVVLDALAAYVAAHGYAPSQRELQARLGLRSVRSVQQYLRRLAAAGVIAWTHGAHRGIALTVLGAEIAK